MLHRAMIAHAKIKRDLSRKILARECTDPDQIRSDRACEFGLWIYGEGGARYGHITQFQALQTVHRRFHEAAASAAEQIIAGHIETAEASVKTGGFELVSRNMTAAILALKAAVGE